MCWLPNEACLLQMSPFIAMVEMLLTPCGLDSLLGLSGLQSTFRGKIFPPGLTKSTNDFPRKAKIAPNGQQIFPASCMLSSQNLQRISGLFYLSTQRLHDKTSHQKDLLDTIPLLISNCPLIQPRSLVPVSQRRLFDPGAQRGREKARIRKCLLKQKSQL